MLGWANSKHWIWIWEVVAELVFLPTVLYPTTKLSPLALPQLRHPVLHPAMVRIALLLSSPLRWLIYTSTTKANFTMLSRSIEPAFLSAAVSERRCQVSLAHTQGQITSSPATRVSSTLLPRQGLGSAPPCLHPQGGSPTPLPLGSALLNCLGKSWD